MYLHGLKGETCPNLGNVTSSSSSNAKKSIKDAVPNNYFQLEKQLKSTIKDFKKGKFEYKADRTGIVHVAFGKSNFTEKELVKNLQSLYKSIEQNRPIGVKGKYFKSLYICTTMGPSIPLDLNVFL